MAVPLVNTLEGGSDGTTITTGNSGGVSGNAFDIVTIGTGYTLAYAVDPAVSGGLCAKITPGATSAVCLVEWDSTSVGTIGPVVYVRFYMHRATLPGAINNRILQIFGGGLQRAAIVNWGSVAPGKFTWADAADSAGTTSTSTMAAGTVYRFEAEFTLSLTVGQIVIKVFLGDSTTPLETLSSAANLILGGTTCDNLTIGNTIAGSNAVYGVMALDGFGIATDGWLGPVNPRIAFDYSQFPKSKLRAPVPVRW